MMHSAAFWQAFRKSMGSSGSGARKMEMYVAAAMGSIAVAGIFTIDQIWDSYNKGKQNKLRITSMLGQVESNDHWWGRLKGISGSVLEIPGASFAKRHCLSAYIQYLCRTMEQKAYRR
jgi:hypothetical protein